MSLKVCVVGFQLEAVVRRLEEQGEGGVDAGSLLELKVALEELITVSEGVDGGVSRWMGVCLGGRWGHEGLGGMRAGKYVCV